MQIYVEDTLLVMSDPQCHGQEPPFYHAFRNLLTRHTTNDYTIAGEGNIQGDLPDFRIYRCPNDEPINQDALVCLVEAKGHQDDLDVRIANDPSTQIARYLQHCDHLLLTNYWDFRFLTLDGNGQLQQIQHMINGCASPEEFEHFINNAQEGEIQQAEESFSQFLQQNLETFEPTIECSRRGITRMMMSVYRACNDTLSSGNLTADQQAITDTVFAQLRRSVGHMEPSAAARFSSQIVAFGLLLRRHEDDADLIANGGDHISQLGIRIAYNTLVSEAATLHFEDYLQRLEYVLCETNLEFSVDLIEEIFLQFMEEGEDEFGSREMGLRPTPLELVRFMIARADQMYRTDDGWRRRGFMADHATIPARRTVILDPATGTGRFYLETLRYIRQGWLNETGSDEIANQRMLDAIGHEGRLGRVIALDLNPTCILMTRFMLEMLLIELDCDNDGIRPRIHLNDSLVGWPGDIDEDGNQVLGLGNEIVSVIKTGRQPVRRRGNVVGSEPTDQPRIDIIIGNPPWAGRESPTGGFQDEHAIVRLNRVWDSFYTNQMNLRNRGQATSIKDPYVAFLRIAHLKSLNQADDPPVICYVIPDSIHYSEKYVGFRNDLLNQYECVADLLGGQQRLSSRGGKIFPVDTGSCVLTFRLCNEPSLRYRTLYEGNRAEKLATLVDQTPAQNLQNVQMIESSAHIDTWLDFEDESLEDYPWPTPLVVKNYQTPGMEEIRDRELVHACEATLAYRIENHSLHQDFNTAQQHRPRLWRNREGFNPMHCHTEMTALGYSDDNIRQITTTPMNHVYGYVDIRKRENQNYQKSWNRNRRDAIIWGDTQGMICLPGQYKRSQNSNACFIPNLPGNKNTLFANCQSYPLQLYVDEVLTPNISDDFRHWLLENFEGDQPDVIELSHTIWYYFLAVSSTPAYNEDRISRYGQESRFPIPYYESQNNDGQNIFTEYARLGRFIRRLHSEIAMFNDNDEDEELQRLRTSVRDWLSINFQNDAGENIVNDFFVSGWATAEVHKIRPLTPTMEALPLAALLEEENENLTNLLDELDMENQDFIEVLGEHYVNLCLAPNVFIPRIPRSILAYSIGGQPVLQNWLSWRNRQQLGRQFNNDDRTELINLISNICTQILIGPRLNYLFDSVLENIRQYTWNLEE